MSDGPYRSPQADETSEPLPAARNSILWTLRNVLIVCAILGVVVMLLLPAVRLDRGAARRSSCSNHLKQIMIGLQNYHDEYGVFPPAYTVDAEGNRLHSWRTLILPYVEQQQLYDKIDLSKPWNDPVNAEAAKTRISTYQCPSLMLPDGHTSYLAVVSPGSCLGSEPRKWNDITDGAANTICVLEVTAEHAIPWMSPEDADEAIVLAMGSTTKPPHPSGGNAAFVDAHIQFLGKDVTADQRRALISIAGDDNAVVEEIN